MGYEQARIYFTTGTGNSFRVAGWLAGELGRRRIPASISMIETAEPGREISGRGDLVAIVTPTHGFAMPWSMLKFLVRMPRRSGAAAIVIACRAGLKWGRVYPPGIAGSALFLTALILFLYGYRVRGTASFDMPSNWFSLHPIQKERNLRALCERARRRLTLFLEPILAGGSHWWTWNNLWEFCWALALAPISALYLTVGRFFLAKLFFANPACDGCGICARYCPVHAITMTGAAQQRPFWRYSCESCMRCSAVCPRRAVEAGHSWGVILYFLTSVPMGAYVLNLLADSVPVLPEGGWIRLALNMVWMFAAMFLAYRGFHKLMSIRAVNRLFTVSTLTHYWGRYREPEMDFHDVLPRRTK